jgi:hypothetical protein
MQLMCNGSHDDLVECYKNPAYKEDQRFHDQCLNDLDDLCATLIQDCLEWVDDDKYTCNEFICNLNKKTDDFDAFFSQMVQNDRDFALQSLLKYITNTKGDPRQNRIVYRNRKWMYVMDHLFAKAFTYIGSIDF